MKEGFLRTARLSNRFVTSPAGKPGPAPPRSGIRHYVGIETNGQKLGAVKVNDLSRFETTMICQDGERCHGEMNFRSLGKLPVRISEIGLGTAQLSNTDGNVDWSPRISKRTAQEIILASLDHGINFFDTGEHYGGVESLLGSLSSSTKSKIVIATKAGLSADGSRNFSKSFLRSKVEQSLRRLQVDCLDVFQLNKPSVAELADESLKEFLESLKTEGKVRFLGVVVRDAEVATACLQIPAINCLQILYNLLVPSVGKVMRQAADQGIGVIVRSPLNSGLLSGNYHAGTTFAAGDGRSRFFTGSPFAERLEALARIQSELGVSGPELLEFSLRFILSNPSVSVVIPGASRVDQLERYVACSALPRLGDEQLQAIEEIVVKHMLPGSFQL